MRSIDIREAHPDDADAMREVQHLTWVATYPNKVYGITKEDSEAFQLPSGVGIPEINMVKRDA